MRGMAQISLQDCGGVGVVLGLKAQVVSFGKDALHEAEGSRPYPLEREFCRALQGFIRSGYVGSALVIRVKGVWSKGVLGEVGSSGRSACA